MNGIETDIGTTVTINGGAIKGGISGISSYGNLDITGGTIIGGEDSGISFMGIVGTKFALSNNPIIKGNNEDISIIEKVVITIEKPLTTSDKYTVYLFSDDENIPFAKGAGAADSIGCFKLTAELESAGYEIAAVDDTLVMRLKTYTITYDPGEGSGSIESQTKTYGKDVDLSSEKFTRPGYTQIGWSTEQGASEVEYAFGADYTENANLTLYPVWKQNEIHFYVDGKEETGSLSLKVGESLKIETKITPEGADVGEITWSSDDKVSVDPKYGNTVTVTGLSDGVATLTVRSDAVRKILFVRVTRSDSTVTAENKTVTYGENVTITAKVEKENSNGIALMAYYDNNVTFKLGDTVLGEAEVKNGEATLTIPATRANGFAIGNNTVILQYSGNGELEYAEGFVTVTVNKKTLTATITGTTTKTYDGTTSADDLGLKLKLFGVVDGDTVSASAEFAYDSADAGERKITANNAKLNGEHADYYDLSTPIFTSGTISPLPAKIVWTDDEFAYDGTVHEVTATLGNAVGDDKFEIKYADNSATNAGDYTAKVTALGNENYTLSGATGVEHEWKITAASQAAPEVKIDFINETLSTDETMEFSADGETWQDCTATMNVAKTGWNGSALTVKIRYKKDIDHLDGEIQNLVIPARRAAPDISEATVSKSQTEISISEIPGCEYSLEGMTWQDNSNFSELDKGETYEIHVRYKATANAFASFVTSKTIVTSSTADGTTELLPGETVAAGDGSIKNLGGEIIVDDGAGNVTTVTLPDGGSVEVDEQGNVTVPGGGEVAVGDNPAVSLPKGGKVEPDGTAIADEVKVGDTDVKGEDVTVAPDGNITVPGEGQVKVGDNPEITLPTGGTVEPDGTVTADEVKVGNTDVKGEDVTVAPDGNITVPGEGSVMVGNNPEIILPTGGTVEPDGTVIADEVKVGNTDVKGEDVTVTPDGNITVPGEGAVKVGDNPEITLPTGGTVEPDGMVIADEVKVGDTDVKGEDVTVTPDGKIMLPVGGKVSVDGEPEKIVPAGATIIDGEINAPAIAEPADGSGSLGDDIILKIEPADERLETADRENLKDIANAIVREVYDVELLKNGVEVEPDKSIKLTVSADVSGAKMKVFTLDNDGKFIEIDSEFDAENGTFSVVTDSLGIFILASEEGQISAEVVASGGAPEVEIGDDDKKALEENLFTDEDEAAIENGDNVKVVMNVEGVSEEDVPDDDLAEIAAFLDDLEGCEVAEYADITLTKITEDGVTGDEIKSEAISEINNPIKLVFDIPESLHKAGRVFSVIRLHDGKAELLNDTDRSDETVTVLTDKFSLYVLIYRDPASQPSHVHSFTAWINVGVGGHLARCAICGKVMSLMPHTMLNGVCTTCGYSAIFSQPFDESDVIEIEVPTEGMIANEEVVEF